MNGATIFIQCLENEGVKYIFGVPGEENEDLLFAIEDSTIQFIPVRHEQGGAFMANIIGRLTGSAGVCLSTLGPGATNLMTGIADAYLDKAPVVAISGQGSLDRLHHESHQMIDVIEMIKPITKWNASIPSIKIIPEVVRKAFKVAQAEKPGATHIELPENIAGEEIQELLKPLSSVRYRRPMPDQDAIQKAAFLLRSAKKPIVIAGNGAIRNRASDALTNLVTQFNIPVVSTFMGKGAVSDRGNQSLGTVGLGFKDYVIDAFHESDVILSVGYDIAEYDPVGWNADKSKRIIHMDFEPAEVFTHYIPEIELVGDLATGINQIKEHLNCDPWDDWYRDIRVRILRSINSYKLSDESKKFNVPGVLLEIRDLLPDDGLVLSDVGSHKMWIARNFQTYCPNGCIISNGLASMGIALPGGIAAGLIQPERSIVSLMGDGGALMNIQELETAKRLGVACTFIILNDNNYGLIEWKQEMHRGKSFGTEINNPDYVQLAESFGLKGYKPESIRDLKQILTHTLNSNELSLIEIPIDTAVNDQLVEELNAYFN